MVVIHDNVVYYKETVSLKEGTTVTKNVDLQGLVPTHWLVGFSKFSFSYKSGQDHHLEHIALKLKYKVIKSETNGSPVFEIKVSHTFQDGSGHSAANAKIDVCAIILGKDLQDENKLKTIRAIHSFSMQYSNGDHHVQNIGATPGGAFMEDYSGNAAKGDVHIAQLDVTKEILKKAEENKLFFVNSFYMSNNNDHHIAEISVSAQSRSKKKLVMSDKSGNKADYIQCTVNDQKAPSILTRIMNVSLSGKNHNLKADSKNVDNLVTSHIQGIAQYNKHYILSHNNSGAGTGIFIIVKGDGSGYSTMEIPFGGFNHPGGVQRYKNYVVVALEDADYSKSMILFYRLNGLSTDNMPKLREPATIKRYKRIEDGQSIGTNEGAAAVGVCLNENKGKYIVGVYNPHAPPTEDEKSDIKAYLDIYEAKATDSNGDLIELGDATFERTKTVHFGFNTAQGIGLVHDSDDQLYLLKFKSPYKDEKANNVDAIDIYRIYKSSQEDYEGIPLHRSKKVACRHMHTSQGGSNAEVHFRWGTGLDVSDDGKVTLLATRRNCLAKKVWINDFT